MSRIVLVTGGGNGLGRAVATRFLDGGDTVFITGRNAGRLADTAAEIEGLPALCAGLSRILWWKNITLLTANLLSIACLAASLVLLIVSWF